MTDWFRQTDWDDSIEREFERRLSRVRLKAQYLRIQASSLAKRRPDVTLKLLDRYFELPEDVEQAQAHVDRATALLALDRAEEAVAAYEAAIAREEQYPRLQTQAYLYLPFVVADRKLEAHYDRALALLEAHRHRPMFPIDHFQWQTARALIAAERGDAETAAGHGREALKADAMTHSGFPSRPKAGLVGGKFPELVARLRAIVGN